MGERDPVTAAELSTFDDAETRQGYRDGRAGEPEPGDNRSRAYWHAWRCGANDRAGISEPWQHDLIRQAREETDRRRGR